MAKYNKYDNELCELIEQIEPIKDKLEQLSVEAHKAMSIAEDECHEFDKATLEPLEDKWDTDHSIEDELDEAYNKHNELAETFSDLIETCDWIDRKIEELKKVLDI